MFNNTIVCALFMFILQINVITANDDIQKIVTYHTSEFGLHYVHALNAKETIYSLSKFSGSTVQEIYDINGLSKTAILSVGQELIIPVRNEAIITQKKTSNISTSSFIKVMYQVKKKDNLFQIAKRYFNTDINTLVDRNNLNGLTISPDQMLHIGWMAVDHSLPVKVNSVVKESQPKEANSVIIAKQTSTSSTKIADSTIPQTAQEVVNVAVQEVNSNEHTGPIKHKYRVVQNTKLPNTEVKKAEVSQATTTAKSNIIAPMDTLSVSYSSIPTETASAAKSTQAKSNKTEATVASTSATPIAAKAINTKTNTDIEDESIKKRDYPDLSFLSNPKLLTKKGVAMWDKNDNEPLNMFILHHEAQINSYIRIENPMLGRIVLAKVVARLPSNVYESDVKMVVSSAVAHSLGVKDARFLSEMKYIK